LSAGSVASPKNDTRRWQFEAAPEQPFFVLSAPDQPVYRIDVLGPVGAEESGHEFGLAIAPWTVLGSPGSHSVLRFDAAQGAEVGVQLVDVSGSEVARRAVAHGASGWSLDIRELVGGRSGVYWVRAFGADGRTLAATKVHLIR